MKAHYLLTILSEDRKGLVSIITGMLNRKGIEIESVSAARTDIHSRVLVTLEVIGNVAELKNMSLKIGNIIEVYEVDMDLIRDAWYQKVALYTIEKEGFNAELYTRLQKYGATIAGYYDDEVIVQKTGRDEDIQLLYNEMEGPYLKSFSKSAAIALKPLEVDESSVISQAA
jgi:acetolactate synthase I/III small subunit